jgi:hypothetical protein
MPVGWDRIAEEKNALVPLSEVDPRLALDLFLDVEKPQPNDEGTFPEDVRADAAQYIFLNHWRRFKLAGLSRIENVARHIGDTGEYPYSAMGLILGELSRCKSDNGEGIAHAIFKEALQYYQRPSHFLNKNEEFLKLLRNARFIVDQNLFRLALRTFVTHLETDISPYRYILLHMHCILQPRISYF